MLAFFTLLSFRPFVAHALQVRDDREVDFHQHFTVGLLMQAGVFLFANLVAIGLRWVPAYAPVTPLLHVTSFLFLLDLPCELRAKMLERQLDWRRLRLLLASGIVLSAVCSVGLALAGTGVYALVLPLLVAPMPFVYDLFVSARWRPRWTWDREEYRPAWRFGSSRTFGTGLVSSAQLLESSSLSATLGFSGYGVFGRATGLAQLACHRTATLVSSSVYPVLTRITPRTDGYRRASALLLRAVAWTVIPLGAICGVTAAGLVTLLYGERWSAVAPLLPWAMGAGALAAIIQPAYALLLAHQRQDRCLAADAWRLAGTGAVLLLCLPFGIVMYLAGLAMVHAVSLGLILYWLHDDAAVSADGVVSALVPPIVAAGAGLLAVAAWNVMLASPMSSIVGGVIGRAGVLGIVYVLSLRILYRRPLDELVGYLPEGRRVRSLLLLPRTA
jgi:O-antigen/teichoic acid export membrane protein